METIWIVQEATNNDKFRFYASVASLLVNRIMYSSAFTQKQHDGHLASQQLTVAPAGLYSHTASQEGSAFLSL